MKLENIPSDSLYDVLKEQPPRPTISTIQWVKGQKYMTLEEFDLLSMFFFFFVFFFSYESNKLVDQEDQKLKLLLNENEIKMSKQD